MPWKPLNFPKREMDAFARNFRKKAKFYLDESVDMAVYDALKELRCNVKTFKDFSLKSRSDEDPFALCWREGLILVSQDRDFLNPAKHPDHRNPGVVVLDVGQMSREQILRAAYFLSILVKPHAEFWKQTRILISHNGEVTIWNRNAESGAIKKTRYRFTPRQAEIWVDE